MKKLVIGLMVLGALTQAEAQVLECKARVPGTVCGSGEIIVNIDQKTNEMRMRLGAVPCWGSDLVFNGFAAIDSAPRDFYKAVKYNLTGKRFREEPVLLGSLIVENEIALLDINFDRSNGHVLYRRQFNLVCEEKSESSGDIE